MRVAVTGTPGTGKTTATERLAAVAPGSRAAELEVVHLNEQVREAGLATGRDPDRGSLVADIDALVARLDGRTDVIFESHLAHDLPADRVVVLRCHPEALEWRLGERGEAPGTARENAEAEALDVVLGEAVERHGHECVYETDTTDSDPDDVARAVAAVVAGEREPSAGRVDFTDYLL